MDLDRDLTPSPGRDEASPAKKIYSVPRRYDLATLFVVSLAYALLFGFMRAAGLPPLGFAIVAGFVSVVGLGQAILFRGKAPRKASAVCGIAVFLAVQLPIVVVDALSRPWDLLLLVLCCSPFSVVLPGAALGYGAGVLIGGVFLVADAVRNALRGFRQPRNS
jgi:hypothetical protein